MPEATGTLTAGECWRQLAEVVEGDLPGLAEVLRPLKPPIPMALVLNPKTWEDTQPSTPELVQFVTGGRQFILKRRMHRMFPDLPDTLDMPQSQEAAEPEQEQLNGHHREDLEERSIVFAQQAPKGSMPLGGWWAKPQKVDLRNLIEHPPAPRFWFRQDWLTPGPMLVAGGGGLGKSMLVQQEATLAAMGAPFFTQDTAAYRSLVWSCEDDITELERRQVRICDHHELSLDSLADSTNLHIESRKGCDNALMKDMRGQLVVTPLLHELREQVNDLAVDVLWIDNAAHAFLGNHDDRVQVTAFVNALGALVSGRPFTVVIVAHPGRQTASEFGGSAAWENAVRMRWHFGDKLPDAKPYEETDESTATVRYLSKRKSNYAEKDVVRFTMQQGLLMPEERQEPGSFVHAITERKADEAVLHGFTKLQGMGIRTTDGKTSPDFLPLQMMSKGLGEGLSKRDLIKAMDRQMTRGVLARVVVGRHANRSEKYGLSLKESVL